MLRLRGGPEPAGAAASGPAPEKGMRMKKKSKALFSEQKLKMPESFLAPKNEYENIGKTFEYMETHYYKDNYSGDMFNHYKNSRLLVDYMKFLISEEKYFQSKSIIDMSFRYLPLAFAILDLPFESQREYKDNFLKHKNQRDQSRGTDLTPAINSIVFMKEIKIGDCKLSNDIILIHRYQELENSSSQVDKDAFVINKSYNCEIIMTNVSS